MAAAAAAERKRLKTVPPGWQPATFGSVQYADPAPGVHYEHVRGRSRGAKWRKRHLRNRKIEIVA